MKCDICRNTIRKTFLGKLMGTMVKSNGKSQYICSECQRKQAAGK